MADQETLAASIAKKIIDAAPSAGELTETTRSIVRTELLPRAKDAELLDHIAEVAAGVAQSTKKVSPVWHAARGTLVGILDAVAGKSIAMDAIRRASTVLVAEMMKVDGDFAAAAKGAAQGAIQGAEIHGLNEVEAASAAATAAYHVAVGKRESAGIKIREIIGDRVSGVPTKIR